ncbi:dihydrodipicolinate synthase family protein [Desertihabitans brevis]|uniref:Dihydrodipicolinate synthase family protein n=1 Tax=Desertihabitans brevis TaxID=2268447 RepID=A0A367YRS1_9ACTN|nr:dihydrodipicolinate synthase family protein [Desertihabitans brevis]RCK68249.1 dihydrodipicolinate synthase family protein [Desertihabitans brevis]
MGPPAVISALPTPFDTDLEVDEPAFRELLRRLPEPHRDVLVAGTTGEFPALTDAERVHLFRVATEELGPDRVVAHVGAASLHQALALTAAAAELGLTRVALLTPYYLPVEEQQVVDFFGEFSARQPGLATYAYLFPERTGATVTPAALATIAGLDHVRGIKVSGSANDHLAGYRAALRADQELYTGDDRRLLTITGVGGTGVVSGCFPVLPQPFLEAVRQPGDAAAQPAVDRVVDVLGPSIARQKLALARQTGRPWRARMSMPALGEEVRREIEALVNRGFRVSSGGRRPAQ